FWPKSAFASRLNSRSSARRSRAQPAPDRAKSPRPAEVANLRPAQAIPIVGAPAAGYKRPAQREGDWPTVSVSGLRCMPGTKERIYRPTDKEPFMNDRQREYFRERLLSWREDILREAKETLQHLQDENQNHPDLADRASSETDRAIELRARDRQRKLIAKIEAALSRIDEGTYGYCEETGEPISLRRLEARPIATLSVEAQERHERRERVYRDE